MKTRSVLIKAPLVVELIEEERDENALKPDECFIESHISMISPGTELSRAFGLKKGASYPVRPGYCTVGVVLNKGSEVISVDVGDRILFMGPHASHHIVSQNATNPHSAESEFFYKIHPDLSSKEAAVLIMGWIAMNGVLPVDVKLLDTVVIFGMGNLGLILSIYYKTLGVNVIGIDPIKHRCDVARAIGIPQVIQADPADQVDAVLKLTDQKGADIVIDATGLSAVIETAVAVTARYGTVVLLGSPRSEYVTNITPMLNAIHMRNLKVIGALNQLYPYEETQGVRITKRRGLDHITKMMLNKTIDVDQLISHVIKPEDIMSAYDGLMNHKEEYTSVLIDWSK
jgi:D-arabinose 1-dehydrogenase-like Zn-dependent alcohol dehydrogenase